MTGEVRDKLIAELNELEAINKKKTKKTHVVSIDYHDGHMFDAEFSGSNNREFQVYSDNSAIRARFGYGDNSFTWKLYSDDNAHQVIGYLLAMMSSGHYGRCISFKHGSCKSKVTKKRPNKINVESFYTVDCITPVGYGGQKQEFKYRADLTREDLTTLLDCMTQALHWSLDWRIRNATQSKNLEWQAARLFR